MKKWPEIVTCFFSIQRKSIEYCEIIFSLLLTCLYYHEKKNSPPKKLSMQKEKKNLPSNIGEKKINRKARNGKRLLALLQQTKRRTV